MSDKVGFPKSRLNSKIGKEGSRGNCDWGWWQSSIVIGGWESVNGQLSTANCLIGGEVNCQLSSVRQKLVAKVTVVSVGRWKLATTISFVQCCSLFLQQIFRKVRIVLYSNCHNFLKTARNLTNCVSWIGMQLQSNDSLPYSVFYRKPIILFPMLLGILPLKPNCNGPVMKDRVL